MDKFLLAYNPVRSGSSGLFIVHCLHPLAIIEVRKAPKYNVCSLGLRCGKTLINESTFKIGDELLQLNVISSGPDMTADQLFKITKRAKHWYKAHRELSKVGP